MGKTRIVLRISTYRDTGGGKHKGKVTRQYHSPRSNLYTTQTNFGTHTKTTRLIYLEPKGKTEEELGQLIERTVQKFYKKFNGTKQTRLTSQVQVVKGEFKRSRQARYQGQFDKRKPLKVSRTARMESIKPNKSKATVHNKVIDMLDDFEKMAVVSYDRKKKRTGRQQRVVTYLGEEYLLE